MVGRYTISRRFPVAREIASECRVVLLSAFLVCEAVEMSREEGREAGEAVDPSLPRVA